MPLLFVVYIGEKYFKLTRLFWCIFRVGVCFKKWVLYRVYKERFRLTTNFTGIVSEILFPINNCSTSLVVAVLVVVVNRIS